MILNRNCRRIQELKENKKRNKENLITNPPGNEDNKSHLEGFWRSKGNNSIRNVILSTFIFDLETRRQVMTENERRNNRNQ